MTCITMSLAVMTPSRRGLPSASAITMSSLLPIDWVL